MLRIMHRVYGPALPAAILIGIGAMGKGGASARRAAPRLVKLARAGCDAALFRFHLGCDIEGRPTDTRPTTGPIGTTDIARTADTAADFLRSRLSAKRKYAAGDDFAIADIVHFGWLWRREFAGIDFDRTPNIARWYSEIAGRFAVHRAVERVNALVQPA